MRRPSTYPMRKDYRHVLRQTRLQTPIPDEAIDEMAVRVYMMRNPLVRLVFGRRLSTVLRMLPSGAALTRHVLDFGTGFGPLLPALSRRFDQVLATDLHLEFASEYARIMEIEVQFLPSPDWQSMIKTGSLDAITALDVLEHIEDLDSVLSALCLLLQPRGSLVISLPTENALYKVGRVVSGIGTTGEYHLNSVRDVLGAAARSGLTVTRSRSVPSSLVPLFKIVKLRRAIL